MKTKRDKNNGILLEKEIYYTLKVNQLQLNILYELCGRINGLNPLRDECDNICESLFEHSTIGALTELFDGYLIAKDEQ